MKILIRGANWIGDAVMTIPAIKQIRCLYPDAHITLLTRPWAEGIFQDADLVDEILAVEDRNAGLKEVIRQAADIRRRRFELGIIFPNSYRSAAQLKLGRVKRTFGYSAQGRRFLLTDPVGVPKWKNERHEVHYYLRLVETVEARLLGTEFVKDREPDISIRVSDDRVEEARFMIKAVGGKNSGRIVALGPGSANSRAKRWDPARYAELAKKIRSAIEVDILLLGSKEDSEIASVINGLCGGTLLDLTGKTGLGQAAGLLAAADVFVSNDMGLAHLAAAVGTPAVVIFGPTNHVTTRPYSDIAEVIREPVECSPCMLRDCPIDHRCMERISADRVFGSVRKFL